MRSHIALAVVTLLACTGASRAQSAYDYPWCAVYGDSDGPGSMSCYYATRELCQQTLSGIGGICVQSPYYGHGPRTEPRPRRTRREY